LALLLLALDRGLVLGLEPALTFVRLLQLALEPVAGGGLGAGEGLGPVALPPPAGQGREPEQQRRQRPGQQLIAGVEHLDLRDALVAGEVCAGQGEHGDVAGRDEQSRSHGQEQDSGPAASVRLHLALSLPVQGPFSNGCKDRRDAAGQ